MNNFSFPKLNKSISTFDKSHAIHSHIPYQGMHKIYKFFSNINPIKIINYPTSDLYLGSEISATNKL